MSGYLYDLTNLDSDIFWLVYTDTTNKSTWERLFYRLKKGQDLVFGLVIGCKCKQTTVIHGGHTGYGGSDDYRFADLNEEIETVPCLPPSNIDVKLLDDNGTTFKGVLIESSCKHTTLGPDDTSVDVWIKIKVSRATVLKMYAMYFPNAANDIIDAKVVQLDKRIEKATEYYEKLKAHNPSAFNTFNAKGRLTDLQKMKALLLQGKIAPENN